jgi:hypothetical protein
METANKRSASGRRPRSFQGPSERLGAADAERAPRYAYAMKSQKHSFFLNCAALFAALALVLFIPVALLAQQAPAAPNPPATSSTSQSDELRISAYTKHEDLKLKVADLKAMPRTTVSVHNEHSKADETYTGVRLADLLSKVGAPLGHDLRGIGLSAYVVATGSDDYVAVIALAEADPSFHAGEVIVADTMNGQALDAKSGPFKLVVTEDKRPARWVRNLVSIELKSAK